MHQVVVLTATYNRKNTLLELFGSLKEQKDKDFSWIIVDDGSDEETKQVLKEIEQTDAFEVRIIHKSNGGKSSAINMGFDSLEKNVEFVLIVDDDERLKAEAVGIVRKYVEKYRTSDCGVIHFNRIDEKGEIMAKPPILEDFYRSFQQFRAEGRKADGYLGYFVRRLGENRFSVYPGEKYIAPSTLIMKVTRSSKLLWAGAVIGETEYLAGGLTKQGRKLRIRNPKGMIEYCELIVEKDAGLKRRLIYSIQGYAYAEFITEDRDKYTTKLIPLTKVMGKALAMYWKKRYTN